jgi:hypothetical protein
VLLIEEEKRKRKKRDCVCMFTGLKCGFKARDQGSVLLFKFTLGRKWAKFTWMVAVVVIFL